ncbi:hypothetical protein VTJ49DRAFT_3831 [Mycothermus thermophilus]|uniref:Yippee domain-containing protein n=1 Tax=Humicola insolens TaxID=85995 RepID=A0ABR3VQU2_HUMIN
MLLQLMTAVRGLNTAPAPPPRRSPSFPRYLLPSLRIPFRRYHIPEPDDSRSHPSPASSTSSPSSKPPSLSTSPTSPTSPQPPTPLLHRLSSTPCPITLRCAGCSADIAYHAQILSKAFFGRHGRAYLVSPLPVPGHPPPPSWWPASTQTPITPPDPPSTPTDKQPESSLLNIRICTPESRMLATGRHTVADIECVVCGAYVGWKYLAANNPSQRYKVGKFILEAGRVVKYQVWEDEEVARENELMEEREGNGGKRRVSYTAARRRSSAVIRGYDYDDFEAHSDERSLSPPGSDGEGHDSDDGVVVFDSEDEEECEEIFAGVWDPTVVAKRRRSRAESARDRSW